MTKISLYCYSQFSDNKKCPNLDSINKYIVRLPCDVMTCSVRDVARYCDCCVHHVPV